MPLTVAAVALALGFAYVLKPFIGIESSDLVFLVAVIGVAYDYGLWPSHVRRGHEHARVPVLLPGAALQYQPDRDFKNFPRSSFSSSPPLSSAI